MAALVRMRASQPNSQVRQVQKARKSSRPTPNQPQKSQDGHPSRQDHRIGGRSADDQFEQLLRPIDGDDLAGDEEAHLAHGDEKRRAQRVRRKVAPARPDQDRHGDKGEERHDQDRQQILDIMSRDAQLRLGRRSREAQRHG
jgi:hypothetical protein